MTKQAEVLFEDGSRSTMSSNDRVRVPRDCVVLLLEDEPLIAMDVEMTLGDAGFGVCTVVSCAEANAWLDRNRPDVAIIDIELRDGRCTGVVARLVAANIPFIVHSGDPSTMHAGTPFSNGIWLGKPSGSDALVTLLRTAVGFPAV